VSFYTDKSILVTGGTGSIGSEIVRRLLLEKPRVVRVLSTDDSKQHDLCESLKHPDNLRRLIGDVRDLERMREACRDIDFVFHAAALKHVDAGEYNPMEFVKTNVEGTWNALKASRECGVQKFMLISTDKAVNPVSVMGGTKFLAERIVKDINRWPGTRCGCVRMGNIRNSRGSLIPKMRKQAAEGGPLTITDRKALRYFIRIEDAVTFILASMKSMAGGEVFIPKMEELRIADFIEGMAEFAGVGVTYTGFGEGEKDREELFTDIEGKRAITDNGIGGVVIVP
jgi:FlaA1/EpsC-like NDP-sugar epimerase